MMTTYDPLLDAPVDSPAKAPNAPRALTVATLIVKVLGVWMVASTSALLVLALLSHKPVFRAVICMGGGLVFLWCVAGGLVMYRCRDRVRAFVRGLPGHWALKFVVFCTLLALAEEVVTVSMTNLAPLFGLKVGEAYVTASANYFDVVYFHSVIMFVPLFIGWAWMLKRWDFHPTFVFLLFGLTGSLAEIGESHQFLTVGMWVFVYGLMIYLPVYSLPEAKTRGARPPRWWWYPVAIFLPLPFVILFAPIYIINGHFHPSNIKIHFPPMHVD